jgi:hypothetical protein
LETRGLHALAREEALDRLTMNPQHAAHSDCIEASVVNEAPDRLRVDAELVRDLADTDQTGLSTYRRHNSSEDLQVRKTAAWADRTKSGLTRT